MRRNAMQGRWVLGMTLLGLALVSARAQDEPAEGSEVPVKQIRMYAENWKWTPNLIRVPAGTRLSIEIKNVDSPHRFEIKQLGIDVALPENETTVVEFLAEKPGTYRWRCSRPCGNGCAKMAGKLVVE